MAEKIKNVVIYHSWLGTSFADHIIAAVKCITELLDNEQIESEVTKSEGDHAMILVRVAHDDKEKARRLVYNNEKIPAYV